MIGLTRDWEALPAAQRARLIEADARQQLSQSLWRAALGDYGTGQKAQASPTASLASLLGTGVTQALLVDGGGFDTSVPSAPAVARPPETSPVAEAAGGKVAGLGVNSRYAPMLESAAARTGVPVAALAAIIDAEAGFNSDGSWNVKAKNPRSSARGLGQFLNATWEGVAETQGSWLNAQAREAGWLDARGQVRAAARPALLAMRYDAEASINAIADFARQNLDSLKRGGVDVGSGLGEISRAAYLAHHLGTGDARKFLGDGLSQGRARQLLSAQIGHQRAAGQIAAAGDARRAHENWLTGYVARKVDPERYIAFRG